MNPLILKMAPTGVVLVVGSYVMWPYLGESAGPPARAAAEAGELPEALLHPRLAAPPARNPFDDPEEQRARVREALRQRLNALVKKIEVARRETRRGPSGRGGAASSSGDPLAGLALNATYAGAGGGGALINGRVIRIGENVRPDDPNEPCVLAEVRLHSVVLRCRGQDLELKYNATAAAPGRAASRAPAPKRPRSRASAPAKAARG